MNPSDLRAQFFRKPWVRVKNGAGEVIPPFALMRITNWTNSNNEIVYSIAKPDATYRWEYLVNGPFQIGSASTAEGIATFLKDGGLVYYNSGTPALGERWGPTASQWYLAQHGPGFHIKGALTTTFNSKNLLVATQCPPGEVRVKNDDGGGSLAAGAGGRAFGIYGGSAGTTDTGLEVTLTNSSTTSWAANKYGFATADAGGLIFGAPQQI